MHILKLVTGIRYNTPAIDKIAIQDSDIDYDENILFKKHAQFALDENRSALKPNNASYE